MKEVQISGYSIETTNLFKRILLDLLLPKSWLWLRGVDGKDYNFHIKGRVFVRVQDDVR